jgi:hypothetical protein
MIGSGVSCIPDVMGGANRDARVWVGGTTGYGWRNYLRMARAFESQHTNAAQREITTGLARLPR